MDCLNGFLSNISSDLVRGAVNQLRYPCCFNTFVKELEKEEANLITTRDTVVGRIADAEKQTKKPDKAVLKWRDNADIDVDHVKQLLEEAGSNQSWCFGHCPNWIWRYNLGKKLANKKKELENFIKEMKDLNFGKYLERVATLPSGILDFPSEKYLSFGSRQKAYEELMEAVKNDKVGMIGLYGMGGCGKTTMAMEVQKQAEAEHLFDEVLSVTVSSTVEVRTIQDKIASSLQYTFPENGERERAKRLNERLSQQNKILVILDDVWQILDFGAIGIPSAEHHKGGKVLITTRSEDVCNSMNCKKKIHLPILEDEEAWTLFQKEADISEGTSDTLMHLARQISNECKGLPVAIAAVASTLKGKDEVRWKVALNKLKSSKPISIEKGLPDPYKCLELSYDNLDDEEAKSLFLLCSVFPEDYEIRIELLTRFAIGLGVVGEVRSYEEASNEVIAAKIKLISCCLLLDAVRERVKMHDLVRDVAHLIAKNENKSIKCEVENDVTLEQNSVRYLWCKKLPNDLDCSNLEFLCITTEVEVEVLDKIFKRMVKLRVLFLKYETWWDKLPLSTTSFETLTNLRCLILSGWKLSDISFVRYMKKLESLSLNECSLPSFLDLQKDDAITQLTKLKLLVLYKCEMERNIFEVIGRIPQLEELCIVDRSEEWDDYSENTIEFYKTISVLQTLQQYTIVLGSHCHYYDPYKDFLTRLERTLALSCFDVSNEAIKGLAKKAKILEIRNIKGDAKNIIPDIFQLEEGGMPELNDLWIGDSKEIGCLVDSNNHMSEVVRSLFSSLKSLSLDNCPNLRSFLIQAITPNPVRYTIFQNLQQLRVHLCGELKYVFSANTLVGLPQLESLDIQDCKKLEEIVEDIIPSVANELEMIEENNSTPSAPLVNHNPEPCFPKLKVVIVSKCHKLKRLFSTSASNDLPYLEVLVINEADELEELIGFEQEASKNCFTFQFHHLKTLVINRCAKLEVVFTLSVVRCFPELECLVINRCEELKQIMEEDVEDKKLSNIVSPQPCFQKLKNVNVHELEERIGCEQGEDEGIGKAKVKLPKLKLLILMHLSNLCQGIELRDVKHCIIDNCPKLSLSSTTTLQELCKNFLDSDFANLGVPTWMFKSWIDKIKESNEVSEPANINEELEKKFIGEVHESEVHATGTSTKSELNGRPSLSPLDVCHHEAHSQELVNGQSSSGSYLKDQHKPLGETESTIAIPQNIKIGVKEGTASENAMMVSSHFESTSSQMSHKSYAREWDSKPENTSPLQMNHKDPSTSKSKSPSLQVSDSSQSILGSIAEMVREHKQIQNEAPVSKTDEFLELEKERKMTSHLQLSEQNLSFVYSPDMTKKIEEIGKEIIQEGSNSMRATIKTLSNGVESISLGSGGAPDTESSGGDIFTQHSQAVDQDDNLNEGQKGIRIQEESSLMDKKEGIGMVSDNSIEVPPGEIGVVSNDHIVARINEEPEKEFVAKISTSEILTRATSLKNSELVERSSPSYLDIPLHKTHSNSESESHPKNIEDFGANDIMSLFQPVAVEEHGEGQVTTSSIVAGTAEYKFTKDNRVVEVLAELKKCLKMPLRDIASSETYSLRLLTVLNFLSGLPFKDATLSDGLKDIIDSMHKEFPSILCSFKQGFATTHKLKVLEAQRNQVDVTLVSKISEAENLMDEAQQKEAVLKERVIRLKKETNDCEAALSSLQEENKKRGAKTIGYKQELENVRKDKSQMVEDQRLVEQELLEVAYKWSVLCSKFELNRIVGRNPS